MTESDNKSLNRGLRQNKIIHSYVMAVDQALLLSTLVAYGAYICICESGLGTMKEASSASQYDLDFRKAGLWKWIGLNIAVNATLSLLFHLHPLPDSSGAYNTHGRMAEIHGWTYPSTTSSHPAHARFVI